jgi:hypothetical protein
MKKQSKIIPPKINNLIVLGIKDCEEDENPNIELKRMNIRMINKIKEDMFKHLNKFKENTNKQLNEFYVNTNKWLSEIRPCRT